jgi:hypothetical protein
MIMVGQPPLRNWQANTYPGVPFNALLLAIHCHFAISETPRRHLSAEMSDPPITVGHSKSRIALYALAGGRSRYPKEGQ